MPASWPQRLNQARALIVPTRFVAGVCRSSGVTIPIEVVPQGVDPEVYHYEERPRRPGLTTLIVATFIERKHLREGIAAWKLAFADDPEARLVLKARFQYGNYVPDDPRISFVDTNETTRGIAHWYRRADVLVALGNEGFGLPLVEGMATGLPVIALSSEGQSDICEDARGRLLAVEPSGWAPCDWGSFGPAGAIGVPSVTDVAARLRWVAEHRDEASDMGRVASAWALRHRNVWEMGPAMLEVMEHHLRPARRLRRAATFWVTSWGSACGIAEYTAHLAGAIPGMTVTADPPDLDGLRTLHVQHEHGIFDDDVLTRHVERARRSGARVAITEHTVAPQERAWEEGADALVSLTDRGASTLRARWPGKLVEHIPHGCPTWFPPRKPSRGRVIGTFGFLGRHKGFWDLLEALRRVPGTELLMFSHAKSSDLEEDWAQAAQGLPVRRIRDFLPTEEVARRLAAEADILVFWYREPEWATASGAVRVGLAAGVPVLTSPTTWFSDLRGATFQPDDLVEGVRHLLEDGSLREQLVTAARSYCVENSWARTAERHVALWRALETA